MIQTIQNNFYLFIFFFSCFYNFSFSQTSDLIRSSRPGQGTVPFTVGKEIFQFSNGIDLVSSSVKNSNTKVRLDNVLTIRYGLFENIDIFTQINNISLSEVGARFHFELDKKMNISILNGFNNSFSYFSKLLYSWDILNNVNLLVNFGIRDENIKKGYQLDYVYSLNLSYSLLNVWIFFVEGYGRISPSFSIFNVNSGFAFLINKDLQIDLYFGNGESLFLPYRFISTGISWRIPKQMKANG
jgi:hypothetical protein